MGCAATSHQASKEPSQLVQHVSSSTVALVLSVNDKVKVYCSGVWVDEDSILTANHCMEALAERMSEGKDEPVDPMGVSVHYIQQNEVVNVGEEPTAVHLGVAVKLDPSHDLALIRAVGKAIPPHDVARLALVSPAIGERVFIVGHPAGQYFTFMEGIVSAYRNSFDALGVEFTGPFMQLQSAVWFGNSGGGAYNTDGELIGIASFMIRAPNMSFFVHLDTIRKFLKPTLI